METHSRWWKNYLGKPSCSPIIPNSSLLRSSIIQDELLWRGGSCAVRIKDDNRTKSKKIFGICVLTQGFIQGLALQTFTTKYIYNHCLPQKGEQDKVMADHMWQKIHMGHHLSWPLYKSDPKQSLYLTFHRLWPNKFLAIISATTFGGLGNEQWIYLMWLQRDLNWALVSISDSLFLNSRGLWDIIHTITRLLNKSWTSCLYYTTLKTHGCHWEGSKN